MIVIARTWQRLEGLALLAAAVIAYGRLETPWWIFAVAFLAPDLSFFGYLAGPRAGAWAYNLAHSLIGPLALGVVALAGGPAWSGPAALIWLAHIGFDRALGYGLKDPSAFGVTHLGLIGRKKADAEASAS